MKITLRVNMFGLDLGGLTIDLEGHHGDSPAAPAAVHPIAAKGVKWLSGKWVRGMLS